MNKWINGIPPVGCECEYKDFEKLVWRKCEILAHKGKEIVFWDIEGEYSNNYQMVSSFRPIQSQQDKEREDVINEMLKLDNTGPLPTAWKKAFCKKLYDEGYRKVNPISDEDIHSKVRNLYARDIACISGFEYGAEWVIDTMLNKKQ